MAHTRAISVLTIEDEPIIRQGISDYLEDCEYSVIQAENGRRGVELFRKHSPDVVLTDLRMPIMSGKEVLSCLSEESPETPIIVVSGVGDISDAIEAIHLGAWDYIIKPIQDMAILLHAIEKCVERATLIRENREYRENLENAKRVADRDMRMAVNVQKNYLPKKPPATPGWEVAFEFRPMAGVSGDFYDFYEKEGTLLGLSVFDVSGHGIASGLITMIAKSIVFRCFNGMRDIPLNTVMENINAELIAEIDNMDNYLTGALVRIDDGVVNYVNAAHPGMLARASSVKDVEIVGAAEGYLNGRFLGISSLAGNYDLCTHRVAPGDFLLLYSDCLIESMNAAYERYGIQRLMKRFGEADTTESCKKIIQFILEDFYRFQGTDDLTDDLTVILLKKTG
jgi:serine phosphatase RsbU (regulator of sigma subunit)